MGVATCSGVGSGLAVGAGEGVGVAVGVGVGVRVGEIVGGTAGSSVAEGAAVTCVPLGADGAAVVGTAGSPAQAVTNRNTAMSTTSTRDGLMYPTNSAANLLLKHSAVNCGRKAQYAVCGLGD